MRICKKCNKEKPLESFVKSNHCKLGRSHSCRKCAYKETKKKILNLTEDEKCQIRHKQNILNKKRRQDRDLSLINNTASLGERIDYWINKRLYTQKGQREKFLKKEMLKLMAFDSILFFDYLIIWAKKGIHNPLFAASLDRKDNNLPYTEDNTIVVPLWLNLAKGIGTYDQIYEAIKQFLKNENL